MLSIKGVRLSGLCVAVPQATLYLKEFEEMSDRDIRRAIKTTGFEEFRIAPEDKTTADFCVEAAQQLIKKMNISADDIDGIVFVSQTPDYIAPATSAILQKRLGLRTNIAVFDINHGCPGFVYGVFQASMMIQSGMQRVLLCVGDTVTKYANPKDRSARLIFGDAGSASFIEKGEDCFSFSFYTDGSGASSLCVPSGGAKHPYSPECSIPHEDEYGNWRSLCDIYMDGGEIMAFSLATVPRLLQEFMEGLKLTPEHIDKFVLHQANKLIVQTIARKLKVSDEQMPFDAAKFGNTSSTSIPLLLTTLYSKEKKSILQRENVILCGFGVGLSVANMHLSIKNTLFMELLEV